MQVITQLAFKGQCRQAFGFYENVLDGKIAAMNIFGASDAKLPPGSIESAPDHIRFADLKIGAYPILGNDVPEKQYKAMQGFHISHHVKTAAEASRIFNALSEGGHIETPLSEVAWPWRFVCIEAKYCFSLIQHALIARKNDINPPPQPELATLWRVVFAGACQPDTAV